MSSSDTSITSGSMYSFLSPSKCAERVIAELAELVEDGICGNCQISEARRAKMVLLVRQLIRDQYEHCAQLAEQWVPDNDLYEHLGGLAVGDGIAETIRQKADERVRGRQNPKAD